jgi:hypothetical protein
MGWWVKVVDEMLAQLPVATAKAGKPLSQAGLINPSDPPPKMGRGGYAMIANRLNAPLRKALLVGSMALAALPVGFAAAHDSSPYLIGHWKLADSFTDFGTGASPGPIVTDNTEFVFLNPTNLPLTLEYAFFGLNPDGSVTFCGCDRDTLQPNGRTRYTMLGEKEGGQFSTKLCPTQTDGTMKTIVFTQETGDAEGGVVLDGALQAGYQIDIFSVHQTDHRTESDLKAVSLNSSTRAEIKEIHKACKEFIGK